MFATTITSPPYPITHPSTPLLPLTHSPPPPSQPSPSLPAPSPLHHHHHPPIHTLQITHCNSHPHPRPQPSPSPPQSSRPHPPHHSLYLECRQRAHGGHLVDGVVPHDLICGQKHPQQDDGALQGCVAPPGVVETQLRHELLRQVHL